MVHGVSVVWLPVTDTSRSVEFYGQTLGMTVSQQEDEWAELEAGGLKIGLNGRKEETPGGEGGAVVAFRPEGGIESAVEELKGKGVAAVFTPGAPTSEIVDFLRAQIPV